MQKRSGFSLVEMSIVIVLIGLIVGGIVAGTALIKGSEQRAILSEFKAYEQAFLSFQEQYQYAPGDMPDATSYWGAAGGDGTGNDATCRTTESLSGTGTCNGNGNGWVGRNLDAATTSTGSPNSGDNYEWSLLWKHLANAKLITGRYSNKMSSATSMRPGYNVPSSKGDGGYTFLMVQGYAGDAYSYAITGKLHVISYGTEVSSRFTRGRVLTAPQAWQIDKKIDDGQPGYGKMLAYCDTGLSACASAATTYLPTDDSISTALWYKIGL